ncbi:MAG: hypothetical protein RL748_50 [Pseudomonadota bacterium]|jgi:DUF1365 family protein
MPGVGLGPATAVAQLCFGQVRHQRLRPAANRFAYDTYFVRLPLRSLGQNRFDCALFGRNRFNLLAFYDADHGDGKGSLLTWVTHLLHEHGIDDADGEIWLQTMPRVLGFVFNPVSFWFCQRRDGSLRAIVVDVHNTFGERHCYLLTDGASIANGVQLAARKVFHVSPFCQVEGAYRFRFLQAARAAADGSSQMHYVARIDYDDASGPLLQTSITGRAEALGNSSVARAFFGMPLMTLGVVVRIHWQALRLWLARVPFFSKPVPPQQKVSR